MNPCCGKYNDKSKRHRVRVTQMEIIGREEIQWANTSHLNYWISLCSGWFLLLSITMSE